MGELAINGIIVATGNSPQGSIAANLMEPFYLGGVPEPEAITNTKISPVTGFTGCIRSVSLDGTEVDIVDRTISGTNVGECPDDICSPNPCQNGGSCSPTDDLLSDFICSCPEGFTGARCEIASDVCLILMPCMHGGECRLDMTATVGYRCICTATHVGPQCETPVGNTTTDYAYAGDSYIAWNVNNNDVADTTLISLQVYPNQDRSDGLIALFMRPSSDFLAIVVDDGFARVMMDLGEGVVTITSNRSRLMANIYVTITVNRKGRDIDWTVSGSSTVSGTAPGLFSGLNVDNHFYIGGVPSHVVHWLPPTLAGVHGFMGCIDEVTVNGQFLISSDLFSSFNVRHCNVDLCDSSPCQNGGTCSSSGNSVFCTCPPVFTGLYCENEFDPCEFANCSPDAMCIVLGQMAVCVCPLGKGGERCFQGLSYCIDLFTHLYLLMDRLCRCHH